jgi:ABC-type multidrug transport system fused ATPase/permease subunit
MVRRRLMRRAQRVARARTGELSAETLELLRSVRAIQAFGQERLAGERFATANRANLSAQITAMKVSARLSPIAGMIIAVDAAAVLFLGVVAVGDGRMSVGTLLALLAYVPGLHEPVSSLTSLAGTFATAQVSRERLSEVFDSTDVLPEPEQPRSAGPLSHGIEVCGLSFAYEDREPVLRDLTLRVGVGETVCVVGPSGAGKSTLLALLARLHDPDGGSIRYDGVDLRQFELASLRGRVAMLPQDTWLIDGSLEDNIAFGRAGTSPREVRAASALALVDEFAERLPDGYRTRVGEGGVLLSGGQRRRIALARAVLRNADVLLLDEPTSGLDAASEALVLSALRRIAPGRTVLVVSHRLTLATHADRVVVLDGGRVVEHGPPGALRARGGAYDRLCRLLEPPAA